MSAEINLGILCRISPDGSPMESWTIRDTPLVIGRGDCADAMLDDDSLSRSHFLVVQEGFDFILVDLTSRNGTLVNGEKVSVHQLQPNDLIQAGECTFSFLQSIGEAPEIAKGSVTPAGAV
jgi:pSer/pThr/pTyr-binding forkhead associated (FHA) protein